MRGRRLRRRSSDRRRSSGSPTAGAVDAAAGNGAAAGGGSTSGATAAGSGSSGGALCVISELMPGGSLEDAIARGELDEAAYALLVGIALQVGHMEKGHPEKRLFGNTYLRAQALGTGRC